MEEIKKLEILVFTTDRFEDGLDYRMTINAYDIKRIENDYLNNGVIKMYDGETIYTTELYKPLVDRYMSLMTSKVSIMRLV